MIHRHKWKIVNKFEQKSRIEVLREAGVDKMTGHGDTWHDLAQRDFIVTYRCECGMEKVKRV